MGQEPTSMNQPVPPNVAGRPPAAATAGTASETADDPAVVRRDIERTRGDMEGTLEAINDRVNPQRVRERRTNRLQRRWSSIRDSVMGGSGAAGSMSSRADHARQTVGDAPQTMQRQTRGNPLTTGMIAFGIGTLIGSALPESGAERRAARAATEKVDVEGAKERLADHAREVQEGVQDKARDAVQDLKGSARDASADVKDNAQKEGERVRDDAQQSGQEVRGRT